ncbi:MAG: 2-C-methyl-D-erythritol 4-phosphate cytidylyltransferase [Clostridiales bacterium]|nr:2-C-methyl-D-erythritol 4-phosphate cytidylyltransferase [Clostridiales bacterium]
MQLDLKNIPASWQRNLYLIIPAAGLGRRMGIPESKQFYKIGDVPVLARTLLAFQDFRSRLNIPIHAVIVTTPDSIDRVYAIADKYEIDYVEKVVVGGATRQDSVAAGIEALTTLDRVPESYDTVFIHDGARCMVDYETIRACYNGGMIYDVCVAATPCKNTIKMALPKAETKSEAAAVSQAPVVDRTLDRSLLYEVQTPQVFKYSVLVDVSARAKEAGITATDDTALAEALGIPVHLITCSYGNIKITTPEDAALAEFMLKERE